jgi:hypothetical protein
VVCVYLCIHEGDQLDIRLWLHDVPNAKRYMDCDTVSRKTGGVVLTSFVEMRILVSTQLFGRLNLFLLKGKIFFKALNGFKLCLECVVHNLCGLYMCIIMRSMQ